MVGIFAVVLFTICSINIQAQESLAITGKVVDATNQQPISKLALLLVENILHVVEHPITPWDLWV